MRSQPGISKISETKLEDYESHLKPRLLRWLTNLEFELVQTQTSIRQLSDTRKLDMQIALFRVAVFKAYYLRNGPILELEIKK